MKREYLQAIELAPPRDVGFAYLLFLRDGRPVGLAACQLMEFRALDYLQHLQGQEGERPPSLGMQLRRAAASRLQANMIVCGATQFTGEFGFYFSASNLSDAFIMRLLDEALRQLARHLACEGWKANGILIKDIYDENLPHWQPLEKYGYSRLAFQPNMALSLRPHWHSMDDYLNDMSSKYRVRARRAFKKGAPLQCRELTAREVAQYSEALFEMYRQVAENAEFNMLELSPDYFLTLKQALPVRFRLFGYFLDGRLLGFFTTLRNGPELECHFMGYDANHNHPFQLYLNMLYEMARVGIEMEAGVERVVYSRTALEIKSSVGAEPSPMSLFVRHLSAPMNFLLPFLIRQLEPELDWNQRHPFN